MQKISDSTSTANPSGEFTEGNPAAGVPATLLKAPWLNAIQRELVALVLGAGINLNASDDSQVLKAVKALAGAAADFNKLANKPTTLGGYGITDAFTRPETTAAIQQAISSLVASSPEALDTLNELAAALGNDPNFATTMTNALAGKAGKATTLGGYGITDAYTKTQVDTSLGGKANKATTVAGYGITDALVKGTGGVGSTANTPTAEDANAVASGGMWSIAGTANAPFANGMLLHGVYNAGQSWTQIFTSLDNAGMYWRGAINGVVSATKKLWDDSNFTPSSKISGNYCPASGFAGGDKAVPYMMHADGTVVALAAAGASFGVGQTRQTFAVGAARVPGTTYYNTTGRPIWIYVQNTSSNTLGGLGTLTVGGVTMGFPWSWYSNPTSGGSGLSAMVLPGESYVASAATLWVEVR